MEQKPLARCHGSAGLRGRLIVRTISHAHQSWLQYNDQGIKRDEFDHRGMGLIPPLNGLRLFEAAARCGSFKLAAQELKLTPGAVSHGVNSLEKWLDVELFDHARDLVLTPAGHDYLVYISEALSMIAKGTNEVLAADDDRVAPLPD